MGLPDVYSKVLPQDHVRAFEDAISWSIDHALDDLAMIALNRADAAIDWDELSFLSGLPARYRRSYTPLFAKQFIVCLIVATGKMADPDRIRQGMLSCCFSPFSRRTVPPFIS